MQLLKIIHAYVIRFWFILLCLSILFLRNSLAIKSMLALVWGPSFASTPALLRLLTYDPSSYH